MSSKAGSSSRAEQRFREAFERLKADRPSLLPKGSGASQNNVAREAGLVPSAFRKSRFPILVAEVQQWNALYGGEDLVTPHSTEALRSRKRDVRNMMHEMRHQRDEALARLVDAEARILALTMECDRLSGLQSTIAVAPISGIMAKRRERNDR